MARKAKVAQIRDSKATTTQPTGGRLSALHRVSKRVTSFSPATEVLTKVRAHPTIFPLYDRATKIGGHPLERVALVSGPSAHGKTLFVQGLGLSFLKANNFYAYVDAEYTTPEEWLRQLMAQYADHPGFLAKRPKSYEETVDAVREFVTTVAEAREKGELDPDTTGLVVIDSIRKLVPKNLMKNILKGAESKEGSIDGASGRGAQMKAALNAQWLDELVPLLYHTKMTLVFIAREYEAQLDLRKLHEPGAGVDVKTGGGKAMIFESSIVSRVTRSWVKEGTAENARTVGERHQIAITKTKVAGKQDKAEYGYFHTSNGLLTPVGFDRARDVVELAIGADLIHKSGSWYDCPVLKQKWQGENKAVKALSEDVGMLDTLEGEARS